MAIGERIRYLRNKRNMTQKYLGQQVGFDEKSADVRMAQYESGTRTPKANLTKALAYALDVSPHALDVPDIDSNVGLMHTFFTLEDLRGLYVTEGDGEICLKLDKTDPQTHTEMNRMLSAWLEQKQKLANGEISKEDYDQWRYRYPELDTTQIWTKVPSQEISDYIVEEAKKNK